MPTAEVAPTPHYVTPEVQAEALPHFSIPGFEALPPDRQAVYIAVPPDKLHLARPVIEREIEGQRVIQRERSAGQAKTAEGRGEQSEGVRRETLAVSAIDTFHRAEQGDPKAKKDLQDAEKELLGKEPSDEDIFKTILESESGNPFAQDLVMEVMLTDEQAQAHQDVLDLFKEFRGDLPSVDNALSPKQQIDFFTLVTKGRGSLPERMDFARKALDLVTHEGKENLFEGLTEYGALNGLDLNETAVEVIAKTTNQSRTRVDKEAVAGV